MKTVSSQLPWYVYAHLMSCLPLTLFLEAVLNLGKCSRLLRYIKNQSNLIDILSDFFEAAANGYGALVSTLTDQQLARALMVPTLE
jgi:hypothetical protein